MNPIELQILLDLIEAEKGSIRRWKRSYPEELEHEDYPKGEYASALNTLEKKLKDQTCKTRTEVVITFKEVIKGDDLNNMLSAIVAQCDEDGDDYTLQTTPSVEVNGEVWRK